MTSRDDAWWPGVKKYSAGLDLGQVNDYSALVVAERGGRGRQRTYVVKLARRWRGLQYTVLAGEVGQILKREPFEGSVRLLLDATGVGRAVLDIFEQAQGDGVLPCWPQPITFTSAQAPGDGTLPKRDAVTRVEVLLAQGRLSFAWKLLLARQIKDELRNFQAKVSATGHATFEASGSGHDDLVTALSLAVHEPIADERLEALDRAYGGDDGEELPIIGGLNAVAKWFRANIEERWRSREFGPDRGGGECARCGESLGPYDWSCDKCGQPKPGHYRMDPRDPHVPPPGIPLESLSGHYFSRPRGDEGRDADAFIGGVPGDNE